MRISDWSSDGCSSDLRLRRWRQALGQRGVPEAAIAVGSGIDDGKRPALPLGPQFRAIGQGETRPPERQRVLLLRHRAAERQQGRGGAGGGGDRTSVV